MFIQLHTGLAILWCLMVAVGLPLLYPTMNRWSKIHYLWLFCASKILSRICLLLVFHIRIYVQ
ncbi:hypothetical protein C8J56DRAFT_971281 [Mycena floridula]|nr:hypothetical protein C8J56DRAFT_971281 [Mycena floridula]